MDLDFIARTYRVQDGAMYTNKNLTDIATVTRASTRWRYNEAGLLVQDAANVAGYDYDPAALAARGLLIEEQRTNMFLNSSALSSGTLTGVSKTANARLAPDGTTTMSKIVEDTSNGLHRMELVANGTAADNTIYAVGVFLAAGERRYVRLNTIGLNIAATGAAVFDLQTGTVVSGAGTIQAIRQGVYRCSVPMTTGVGPVSPGMRIHLLDGSTGFGGVDTYIGDGTSGAYAWGCQFEAGSFTSSHIPTTSAQVTRAVDSAIITDLSKIGFNPSEGTIVVSAECYNANAVQQGGSSPRLMVLYSSTNANENLSMYRSSAGNQGGASIVTGGQGYPLVGPAIAGGAKFKMAFAYKGGDSALCVNGGAIVAQAQATMPSGIDRMSLGSHGGAAGLWGGWLTSVSYISQRVSNTRLQSLTA